MRFEIEYLGETAVLVHVLDASLTTEGVQAMAQAARNDVPGIVDAVPAIATLLLRFDPAKWPLGGTDPEWMDAAVEALAQRANGAGQAAESRLHRIPVCYGGEHGPDLAWLAERVGLSRRDAIEKHSAVEYRVTMLGFAPGFAYLGGLDPALQVPRLDEPRKRVPAGSVAIAGAQTAIYPRATPGGWRIIGNARTQLFDPSNEQRPTLFMPGDRVCFEPVAESS